MNEFLKVAIAAANAAAEIHKKYAGKDLNIKTKSNDSDLVTIVDKKSEEKIREIISASFPDHAFLGEESGASNNASQYRWIVDPLDGTVNYAHGFPFYCVSVALEISGVRSIGVVQDSVRDEIFVAVRGQGATLNGKPIRVSNTPELRGAAMLATGFPYNTEAALGSLEVFSRFLAKGIPIRRPGAAALDLCYVACGRLDGFWETKLNAWDCAAGILIIEEAGGTVTGFAGQEYLYDDKRIVASNGTVHKEMIATISGV